ncbi:MAG: cyanophycin synthetase [Deltaproteobacteria bacterium]
MKIISMDVFQGRNIYSHKPVVKMTVDIGELADTTTNDIPGFNARLLNWFPGLNQHHCSTGHEGGLVERLFEGTFMAHVTEHLALELQCINGYEVFFGKTRILEEPSTYCIIYEYSLAECARDFGETAVDIVTALIEDQPDLLEDHLAQLQRKVSYYDLGPSTRALMAEARKRSIPVRRLDENSLLQFGYGSRSRLIEASLPDSTSCIAVDLAKNKQLVKKLLHEHGIPVPEGCLVYSENDAVIMAERMGYPVVIKPFDANQGRGVSTEIDNEELLRSAYRLARKLTGRVMLEKHIPGKDYRVLVVGNRAAAAAERTPPFVIGDGFHTIEELVAQENTNPLRGWGHEKPMTRIHLDEIAVELLGRSGWDVDSVPEPGQAVYLRQNGNLSTGGNARDCTATVHPDNQALAVKAAHVIGLEVAGIDLVCPDISEPLKNGQGAVIEVNAAPGLRMHLYPGEGEGINVASDMIDFMYPEESYSIPIISITGTNGKTTVTRMVSHVLALTGKRIGMTCSSGTYIDGSCIKQGDNTGPRSARSLLYRRDVDIAILETARGGIVRHGLGYDLADVGAVLNISDDHLGLDGVETLEDLAFAKALVVEAIKPSGFAVLNADDIMLPYLARGIRAPLIYFAKSCRNPIIEEHIAAGNIAVTQEEGHIVVYWQGYRVPLIQVADIPITYGGKAACNIENALAAAACLFALGVPDHIISQGLASFTPDPEINAGRFNLFDMGEYQVLLDYAHNLGGYHAVIDFAGSLPRNRSVAIIGLPGDRRDSNMTLVGKLAGSAFDQLYIKEDQDPRGRARGETANLLFEGALAGGARPEDIKIVLDEADALRLALSYAEPGDLIVMFYEKFDPAYAIIQEHLGKPRFTLAPPNTIENDIQPSGDESAFAPSCLIQQ